jgi:hypothetical protein
MRAMSERKAGQDRMRSRGCRGVKEEADVLRREMESMETLEQE